MKHDPKQRALTGVPCACPSCAPPPPEPRLEVRIQGRKFEGETWRPVELMLGTVGAEDFAYVTGITVTVSNGGGDLLHFPFEMSGEGREFFVKWPTSMEEDDK